MTNTRITHRIVNSKRHTLGFVLTGGRQITRSQAIDLASKGKITGVRVSRGSQGRYIQSTSDRNLYDLPISKSPSKTPARKPVATKAKRRNRSAS